MPGGGGYRQPGRILRRPARSPLGLISQLGCARSGFYQVYLHKRFGLPRFGFYTHKLSGLLEEEALNENEKFNRMQ